jgi:hypothetical protein
VGALALEAVLDAEERQTVAVLVDRHPRQQRRRRHRAREGLFGHRRGLDVGLTVAAHRPVLHARYDQAPQAALLVGELRALLETDALGLAVSDQLLEERVGDLEPFLGERHLGEVAPAGGLRLLARRLVTFGGRRLGRLSDAIELGQLDRELELELGGIDALGFGEEDAAFE